MRQIVLNKKEVAMTAYARSDVAAVSISADHGGCGQSHSRPVIEGAPAKVWALTCHGGCEDYLRNDPLWSGTPHTVPETPDETAIRQDSEKRGQVDQQMKATQALMELAKLGELPTAMGNALAQAFTQFGGNMLTAQTAIDLNVICRNGHSNGPTIKFCGECGANMHDSVNKQSVAALSASETVSSAGGGVTDSAAETLVETSIENLDELSYTQLKEIAKAEGLAIVPSRVGQLDIVKLAHAK